MRVCVFVMNRLQCTPMDCHSPLAMESLLPCPFTVKRTPKLPYQSMPTRCQKCLNRVQPGRKDFFSNSIPDQVGFQSKFSGSVVKPSKKNY